MNYRYINENFAFSPATINCIKYYIISRFQFVVIEEFYKYSFNTVCRIRENVTGNFSVISVMSVWVLSDVNNNDDNDK